MTATSSLRVLVVGQGGREHALCRALAFSPSVSQVLAAPGSDGIALVAEIVPWDGRDFDALADSCVSAKVDLVVIGPDNPLADGIADVLRARGLLVFGPSRDAAQLEGSKVFAKEFMVEAGIPTARYFTVASTADTLAAAREFSPPYVLKADGLALGKGVFICADENELRAAAEATFDRRIFGASGDRALLEEFTPGYELSFIVLTNGRDFEPLPLAQDHKRLLDGDRGPNTGGMGVVAPIAVSDDLAARIKQTVFEPAMRLMAKRGFLYRGVLFVGLMIGEEGPSVLEFNVRFGDPETQAQLPLLNGDWGAALRDVAEGRVPRLKWKQEHAACVVLAADGYPESPVKGAVIAGLEDAANAARAYVLHAGTKRRADGAWTVNGGRCINAVGLGASRADALANAYALAARVRWPGARMRADIGGKS